MVLTFEFDALFAPFVPETVARLKYLYPVENFKVSGDFIEFEGIGDVEILRRDIAYTLYRAKIASDGREFRELLQSAVLSV